MLFIWPVGSSTSGLDENILPNNLVHGDNSFQTVSINTACCVHQAFEAIVSWARASFLLVLVSLKRSVADASKLRVVWDDVSNNASKILEKWNNRAFL